MAFPGIGVAQDPSTGEVLPVETRTEQLTPSIDESTSRKVEDEEAKRRREAMEASAKAAQQARATEVLGVVPDTSAPVSAPVVAPAPADAPTGTGPTGGIPAMPNLPAQVDANAAAQASLQKQLADERAAKDAELVTRTAARIKNWEADMESARSALAEARKPQADKSFLTTFFQAIASGMGAYGASMRGGENHAARDLENQSKMEYEQHRARIEDAVKNLEMLGKTREQIDSYTDKERAKFIASQQARIDQTKAAAESMLKRFPEAQNKAFAQIAADQAKLDAEKQATYKEIGVSEKKKSESTDGTKLSSTTGKGTGAGQKVPLNVVDNYLGAKKQERDMRAGGDAIANEKDWADWRQAVRDEVKATIAKKGTFGAATNIGQVFGGIPLNMQDRMTTPGMRAINRAMAPIVATQARKLDSVGAMSDVTLEKAEGALALMSMEAKEAAQLAYGMADDAKMQHETVSKLYPDLAREDMAPTDAKPTPSTSPKPATRAKTGGNGPIRMDALPKDVQADLREASRIMTDPKASPKAKAAARKFTEDVARGAR